jgi:hypothetical protein
MTRVSRRISAQAVAILTVRADAVAEGMTPEVTILTIFLRPERAKETFPDTL